MTTEPASAADPAPDRAPRISRRAGRAGSETPLAARVAQAKAAIGLQYDPALYEQMSDAEMAAEIKVYEWMRAKRRGQTKRVFRWDLAVEYADRRAQARARREDADEQRWHARAAAARQRGESRDAQAATLLRRTTAMSRNLRAVVAFGLLWSGINVGRNLAPAADGGSPTWWVLWALSFFLEAMISIPLREIMTQSTTAAQLRTTTTAAQPRTGILVFEVGLLLVTVGLNAGPHIAAGDLGRAAEDAVAPTMVVVILWVHSWLAARYGMLLDGLYADARPDPHRAEGIPDPGEARPPEIHGSGGDPVKDRPPVMPPPYLSAAAPDRTALPPPPMATGRRLSEVPLDAEDTPDLTLPRQRVPDSVRAGTRPDSAGDSGSRYQQMAEQMVRHRVTKLGVEQLMTIFELAEQGMAPATVATEASILTRSNIVRSTVDRVIDKARPYGLRVPGRGEVIAVRTA
ncbi:hypothetical protein [Nocardia sp. alder85J]|uniref:hypothetical protein n=1 Tax=Nocardia sp. alder85J TaxID=2862949 RepID=UPI001CD62354|nr:hypothetical protein [Nocardia sp. alder85J]MCX4097786.1 hypothetical protein [Nocardia sp. alder85J]